MPTAAPLRHNCRLTVRNAVPARRCVHGGELLIRGRPRSDRTGVGLGCLEGGPDLRARAEAEFGSKRALGEAAARVVEALGPPGIARA